ncbi:MAG: ATP-binding protein [Solirubrobacteraceae bacterium]
MTQTGVRAVDGERRVVTLLAADLVGSTALGETLDPEEARLVVGDAVTRIVAAVESMGGTVEAHAGDGVFALFGAPTAHEDDAERAVHSALRVVEEISGYAADVERGWGITGFAVRVGLATGAVVVGSVGGGDRVEYRAIGDAANTAARLQAAADPATVLADDATRRLVGPLFNWGEPRSLRLKGKAAPTLASQPLSRAGAAAKPRSHAPLVGRERELAAGKEAIDRVLAGAGGVLFVTGEPGIGKSRLLSELRAQFESSTSAGGRTLWLEGRAASYSEMVPYGPFQHLLREWIGLPAGQPELRVRVALRRATDALFGDGATEFHPWLGLVLGLTPGEAGGELRPEVARRRAIEATHALLTRLAADGPVVIAVDDLQWADATSLELVETLVAVCDREPVLLVLAQRTEREHACWNLRERALREVPHRTREVALSPLPEHTDEQLLGALVGPTTLPTQLKRQLLATAGGNPFFLEELLHSLEDAGALVCGDGGWRLERDVDFPVPETVHNVILARLDRLPPESRSLLAAASVLGRQFGRSLLEAVVGVDPGDALRELQRLDLVRETRRWPDREYSFKHPLIRDTAYRGLLVERRRELHARTAAALVQLFPERSHENEVILASHLLEAGLLAEALPHLRSAGDGAARVHASHEALEHYGTALSVAERLEADDGTVGALHLARGQAFYRSGRFLEARADYEAALEHARTAHDRSLELRALEELGWLQLVAGARIRDAIARLEDALAIAHELSDDEAKVRLLSHLAVVHSHGLRFAEARRLSRNALHIAGALGDDQLVAAALDSAKTVAVYLGEFGELRAIVQQLEQILRRYDDSWYLQWTVFESFYPLAAEGLWSQAATAIEAALELNRRIGDRANEPYFLAGLGWLHRARGDYGRALACGRRAAELASALDHRSWIAWSETLLSATLIDLNAFAEAADHLQRGLAHAEGVAAPLHVFRCVACLAHAQRALGDLDRATTSADRAERLLKEMTTPPGTMFLHGADAILAIARVRAAAGESERAQTLAGCLVAAARRSGWTEPVAAGSRLLAELHLLAGDTRASERHLRSALAVAADGDLPGEQWRAHAELAQVLAGHGDTSGATAELGKATVIVDRLAARIPVQAIQRKFLDGARTHCSFHPPVAAA